MRNEIKPLLKVQLRAKIWKSIEIHEIKILHWTLNRKNLLSKARITNSIRKNIKFSAKVTDQQKLSTHIDGWRKCNFTLSNLSQLAEDINSKERFDQYRGTIGVRKLLSIGLTWFLNIWDLNVFFRWTSSPANYRCKSCSSDDWVYANGRWTTTSSKTLTGGRGVLI